MVPFDRSHTIYCYSFLVTVCLSCTVYEILSPISPKFLACLITLATHFEVVCHQKADKSPTCIQNLTPLVSSVQEMRGAPEMFIRSCDCNHAHLGTFSFIQYSFSLYTIWRFKLSCFGDMKEDRKVEIGLIWGGCYHPRLCLISALGRINMTFYLPLYIKRALGIERKTFSWSPSECLVAPVKKCWLITIFK